MEQEIKIRRVDFYPTDWLEGTIGLTHVERSVYITICAAIYAHGGPVAVDHVRRLCPGPGFAKALRSLESQSKVRTSEGLCYQARAEKEVSRARDRIETARINGAAGGRKNKRLAKATGFFQANPARKANKQQHTKENPSSSSLPSSARAFATRKGYRTRGDGAWKPIGTVLGHPAPTAPQTIEDQLQADPQQQHMLFLQSHGAPGELKLYYEAAMSDDAEVRQRMFDLTDAKMREREEREIAA